VRTQQSGPDPECLAAYRMVRVAVASSRMAPLTSKRMLRSPAEPSAERSTSTSQVSGIGASTSKKAYGKTYTGLKAKLIRLAPE
jgi:hypothetical protein